jgi:hypothetical protein
MRYPTLALPSQVITSEEFVVWLKSVIMKRALGGKTTYRDVRELKLQFEIED